ncbi:GLPGLI family protein [Planktosalinus lacus]|uniref:GLPGLI family protein n=2 Tax=Planktosalinus lacus TaxID=1526573 RepID=A0A8J2V8R9_9FLAO|nr:GLPGLI family protein [Planktosalinus lacus]
MDFGGPQMTEQMKEQIAEMMKKALEKTYILNFNKEESSYKEEEKLAAPGAGGGMMAMMGNFTAGAQYKNTTDDLYLQEQEFFGKQFLITDTLPKLEWKLVNVSKQIGQYVAFKATAIKQLGDTDFQSMRRRNSNTDSEKEATETKKDSTEFDLMEEIEIPKEIEIVAWYTPQIPIPQGPGEFSGLPGLILEIQADRTSILCTKIVLNPKEIEIKKPSKGQKVSQEEYQKIVKDKMEEMQEMYGGRGRGRGMQIRMN